MNLFKKSFLILLSLLLSIGILASCSKPATKETSTKDTTNTTKSEKSSIELIKEKGVFKVGIFTDKPPFGYTDEKGNPKGFEVDLAKKFTKDLLGDESKLELVPVEPANRIPFLQSNKVDLILTNMTVTDERKEVVDFTNPYLKVAIQIVAKKNSTIKSIEDLNGKKVILTKGTTADIYFAKKIAEGLKVETIKFDNVTESFQALKDGRGDAYVNDNLLLFGWAGKNPEFKVLDVKLEEPSPIAPAVKKGNTELLNWVNDELKSLSNEKYLEKIYYSHLKAAFNGNVKDIYDVIVKDGQL